MIQNLNYLLFIISNDFFISFGIYSILYLILSIFTKKEILYKIDDEVCRLIIFLGIIYFLIWFAAIIISFTIEESRTYLLNRMFGKYCIGFWLQPLFWIGMTQLLRIKKIQKNWLFRILFSFFFIFSFEKIVIIITSFHRDYLPSAWTMYSDLDFLPDYFLDKSNLKNNSFFIVCRNILFHPKYDFELSDKEIKLHVLRIKTVIL